MALNATHHGCAGWASYPWAGMIATLAAIGVLILEGLITSMFERLHAKTAAASQGPAGVAGNGNAAEFTTANVYGHAHDPESTKQDKVRHLTIAQVRPGQPTHGCRANQRAYTSRARCLPVRPSTRC